MQGKKNKDDEKRKFSCPMSVYRYCFLHLLAFPVGVEGDLDEQYFVISPARLPWVAVWVHFLFSKMGLEILHSGEWIS